MAFGWRAACDSVGGDHRDFTVRAESNDPAAVVDEVVVSVADWAEVGEIGTTAAFPPMDVVDLTVVEVG